MNIRDQRQEEAVQAYLNSDRHSIINACPRFGKIKVALEIMKRMDINHVWILAPRNDIFKGWDDDMKKFDLRPTIVGETTFTSIKNINTSIKPKLIIIDEPHEMSINQQLALKEKIKGMNIPTLGLTGTLTDKTKNELYDNLNLDTCYTYTIDQGVKEGILVDYQIFLHQIKLLGPEGQKFSRYYYAYKNAKGLSKAFISLKIINLIQNSQAKLNKTKELLARYPSDRILVFCGVTAVADSLDIPVYHSKAKEKQIFQDFCNGVNVNQLATIKMMQAGITITPIHKGIINYMSGNPEDSAQKICRFLGFEYDNPEKKAEIHIISSNEDFEQTRLKTGLAFFDQFKISTIKI